MVRKQLTIVLIWGEDGVVNDLHICESSLFMQKI